MAQTTIQGSFLGANTVDGTKIAMGSDAQGDVMHYNGTDWVRLGFGTSGYFLKTLGEDANPLWAEVVSARTVTGDVDNAVITWVTGNNTFQAEPYLLFDGNSLDVKNDGTASSVKLYCESSNAHAITLKSPAHSTFAGGSWTLTLPGINGGSGEFLQTDGNGVTIWAAAPTAPISSITAGGADNNIVVFSGTTTVDGSTALTFASGVLTVTGHILPGGSNNTYDLGSSSAQWGNIYTEDFHLNNTLREKRKLNRRNKR